LRYSAQLSAHYSTLPTLPNRGFLIAKAQFAPQEFAMPTLSSHDGFLDKREWSNTVGQSGMTPTAFAFLIPVFVVVVFAPL
jgi:hypothetical protein